MSSSVCKFCFEDLILLLKQCKCVQMQLEKKKCKTVKPLLNEFAGVNEFLLETVMGLWPS